MYRIGIDLGGTNIAVGIVDEEYRIVHKESIPTGAERDARAVVADMAKVTKTAMANFGITEKDVKGIGVGAPGSMNEAEGEIIYANNLHFRNVPVRDWIREEIDLPVFIGNDANCAALGEAVAGGAKEADTMIMITIGTGIGGGIIIDKKIYSGFNFAGAELGHHVISVDGEQCTCGRKGCWEAYASATALIRQTKAAIAQNPNSKLAELGAEKVNGKTAFDAMREGCPVGTKVVETYVRYFAEGIVNMINIFQPQILLIGGGVCKEGDYLVKPLMEIVEKERYSHDVPQTEIRIAALGNDAGIIGAAALA